MGKDKILDPSDKGVANGFKVLKIKTHSFINFLPLLFAVCCLVPAGGCAMPKVIVLDDPLSPEEHINLGFAYEKNGEIDNALREYRIASKKISRAYLYMGNVYFKKNEFGKAESAYETAMMKDPDNPDVYNNLAWLYYTKGEKLDKAEKLALRAMELNPSRGNIYGDTLDKIRDLKISAGQSSQVKGAE